MNGEGFPSGSSKIALVNRVPLVIYLANSPFNYSTNLSADRTADRTAAALITGNAVVFKPATNGSNYGVKLVETSLQTSSTSSPAAVL